MDDRLTYRAAGVDVEAGYSSVELIKKHVKRTAIDGLLGGIGDFGGMFEIPSGYKSPVLVSGTDGVGTKLQMAFMSGKHDTIGIDCVAMCVNDIVCQGAKPLFFLDYIGCGKNEPTRIEAIVKGVSDGCVMAGCALVGGETAEMPGFYKSDEYDMAGFSVGIVEKERIITKANVKENNILIGIPSSGLHSNGYSLVRKLFFEKLSLPLSHKFDELSKTLGEELLTPTKIYVKTILNLIEKHKINGIANITGGGFIENIPRIITDDLMICIDEKSVPVLPIFELIEKLGNVDRREMFNTFNMGIGMVMAVDQSICSDVINSLNQMGEQAVVIGSVQKRQNGEVIKFA